MSEKHTGFIVNTGGATCEDIKKLIRNVRWTVFEKTGVQLTPEIKFIGEFLQDKENKDICWFIYPTEKDFNNKLVRFTDIIQPNV